MVDLWPVAKWSGIRMGVWKPWKKPVNGQPSDVTIPFEYQSPKVSGIKMNLAFKRPVFRWLLYFTFARPYKYFFSTFFRNGRKSRRPWRLRASTSLSHIGMDQVFGEHPQMTSMKSLLKYGHFTSIRQSSCKSQYYDFYDITPPHKHGLEGTV